MIRKVVFYRRQNGKSPVEEYLDSLSDKVAQKAIAVLELVQTEPVIPIRFFRKIVGTDLWECRIRWESNIYRLFCFFYTDKTIVVLHGFTKKTQKTPRGEIERAERYRADYVSRRLP